MKELVIQEQKYYKIDAAACYFEVHPSFLKKRMGTEYIEGVHYFIGAHARITRWSIEALERSMFRLIAKDEDTNALLSVLTQ